MTEPLRIGIAGTGAIAQIAHLPVLSKLRGINVVALCDNDRPKAQALARRFKIPNSFDDLEDLLRYSDVDAVAVCTPNHLHEPHTIAALSAGKHVLSERPLTLTAEGCERVLEAARRYDRVVMVGMNHRFRRDVAAVRAFLRGVELGEVLAVRGGWYTFRPTRQQLGWRLHRQEAGGGGMLDLGFPVIDLGLWLVGNPRACRVSAVVGPQRPEGVEDGGCALISCEGGLSLFVDVTWSFRGGGERFWLDVHAARGGASINPLKVYKDLHGTVTDVTPTGGAGRENPFISAYRAEWEFFLAAVRGEVQSTSARDQLALLRLMDAIYRSADEGHDVEL